MKRAIKKQSSLYSFLAPFLAVGDEAAIDQARTEYWKQYKANWKRQKRTTHKTLELSFTKSEWNILSTAAGRHSRSKTSFIKQAALAYCSKQYLIPNQSEYNNIREALHMMYAKLKTIESIKAVTPDIMNELLSVFTAIQQTIAQHLQTPQTLEEKITETIQALPEYKAILQHLLETT